METWFFFIIATFCIYVLLKYVLRIIVPNRKLDDDNKLPPGTRRLPVIGNLWLLLRSSGDIEPILRDLRDKKGPVITFWMRSRPFIFISSHSLAHKVLIQNGAIFSDRPTATNILSPLLLMARYGGSYVSTSLQKFFTLQELSLTPLLGDGSWRY
ncbi:hypothetical protein Leryth_000254 [Lithospermum erythrorhizon]|nr:hypothetical protein Leryth_000254 [Lithospermum erythrorhizon]